MANSKLVLTKALSQQEGVIFFLHGSCDSGKGLKSWVRKILGRDLEFSSYSIVFPTALTKPYRLLNGLKTPVWFDRPAFNPNYPEDQVAIAKSASYLTQILAEHLKESPGLDLSRVIIGGFAMGGTMAMHMGYRIHPDIAGVFTLSSYLCKDSQVYECLERDYNEKLKASKAKTEETTSTTPEQSKPLPNLFMSQPLEDPIVRIHWAKETFGKLRGLGVPGYFHTINGKNHAIKKTQLILLQTWINEIFSKKDSSQGNVPKRARRYTINDEGSVPLPMFEK